MDLPVEVFVFFKSETRTSQGKKYFFQVKFKISFFLSAFSAIFSYFQQFELGTWGYGLFLKEKMLSLAGKFLKFLQIYFEPILSFLDTY